MQAPELGNGNFPFRFTLERFPAVTKSIGDARVFSRCRSLVLAIPATVKTHSRSVAHDHVEAKITRPARRYFYVSSTTTVLDKFAVCFGDVQFKRLRNSGKSSNLISPFWREIMQSSIKGIFSVPKGRRERGMKYLLQWTTLIMWCYFYNGAVFHFAFAEELRMFLSANKSGE